MANGPKLLVVTTSADLSRELFDAAASSQLMEIFSSDFDAPAEKMRQTLAQKFDFLYFRDPFNDNNISPKLARLNTTKIVNANKGAYSVDKIAEYNNMLFEDKWRQYQKFADFMPPTQILESFDVSLNNQFFVKKRISARSKGVIFDTKNFPKNVKPDDYLIQPKLKIDEEYRVFMIDQKIIMPVAVKQSKTSPGVKVKLIGVTSQVHPQLSKICQAVYSRAKFDFVGLDIARSKNNFWLLEVNRSPQFNGYFKLTSLNLAEELFEYLLQKVST